MADSMVTARMPQAKKDAGNKVLGRIGISSSRFINSAYDYLIKHGSSPFDPVEEQEGGLSVDRLQQALGQIESMCLPASNRFATMSDDEIRRERLARQGFEAR